MDAVQIVEDEVRELIRRRGLDPLRQAGEVRRLVEAAVSDYDERALLGPLPPIGPLETARRFIYDAVAGFGALQPLLDDPGIIFMRRFPLVSKEASELPCDTRSSLLYCEPRDIVVLCRVPL